MYSVLPSFVLGFHGCDRTIVDKVVKSHDHLRRSNNKYDWLADGIYFWENNPERALSYANMLKDNPHRVKGKVEQPAVVGAVINLGYCLNLIDEKWLKYLKMFYKHIYKAREISGEPLPKNRPIGDESDLLLRELDRTVIQTIHKYRALNNERPFDSVRGVFWEGAELYPNAGFKEKNHIQISVRNPNCIKGYFLPREADSSWEIP